MLDPMLRPLRQIMLNRRILILALMVLAVSSFASKEEKKEEPLLHSVGFSLRQFPVPEDYNWRGTDDHTLNGIIWYPAEDSAGEKAEEAVSMVFGLENSPVHLPALCVDRQRRKDFPE
jgi:hypothetical protein